MENTQAIDNLMSEMLNTIEKEISDSEYIQQGLKNLQDTESSEALITNLTAPKKNFIEITPNMDILTAEIEHDLNNTTANLDDFEKCVFDVLSTQQNKVTYSKAYKQLESLESRMKLVKKNQEYVR